MDTNVNLSEIKELEEGKPLLDENDSDPESKKPDDQKQKKTRVRAYIGTYEEIPEFIKDNEYIRTGYRIGYNTICRVMKSLFMGHNETVNIWTHLFGVVAFFACVFYVGIWLTKGHEDIKSIFPYYHDLFYYLNDNEIKCDVFLTEFGDFKVQVFDLNTNRSDEYYLNFVKQAKTELDEKMLNLNSIDRHIMKDCEQEVSSLLSKMKLINNVIISTEEALPKEIKYSAILIEVQINQLKAEYTDQYAINGVSDGVSKIPLLFHIFGASICLFFSSLFHLYGGHSKELGTILARFDYGGIAVLISGSAIPIYIYTFYCSENAYFGYIYSAGLTAACVGAFIITLIPKFDAPKFRKGRAILFVAIGLSAAIPGFHIMFFRKKTLSPKPPYFLLALGGALYILGAIIYSTRFPERFRKKTFDYIGNSHNIWHLLVLSGAAVHFSASILTYLTRLDSPCPA